LFLFCDVDQENVRADGPPVYLTWDRPQQTWDRLPLGVDELSFDDCELAIECLRVPACLEVIRRLVVVEGREQLTANRLAVVSEPLRERGVTLLDDCRLTIDTGPQEHQRSVVEEVVQPLGSLRLVGDVRAGRQHLAWRAVVVERRDCAGL